MSDNINHSKPIQIQNSQNSYSRHRSGSQSSDDNSPPLRTPISTNTGQPVSTSPTSPILSYLFNNGSAANSTSPLKSPSFTKGTSGTFPFSVGRSFNSPGTVPEELDEDDFSEVPSAKTMHAHSRRLSTGWPAVGPRFGAASTVRVPATDAQHERTAGMFRRLSLGGAFVKPQISQPVPEPLQSQGQQPVPRQAPPSPTRPKRSATLSAPGDPRNRRAPSPMGERILKGHFDGFN